MSDFSDDSDIEAMMQRAKTERKRVITRRNSYSDEDDDDEEEQVLLDTSSNKKQKITVEQKLAGMKHQKKISLRNRQTMLKNVTTDSSDEESDDEDKKPSAAPPQKKPTSSGFSRGSRNEEIIIVEPNDASERGDAPVAASSSNTDNNDDDAAGDQPNRRSRRLRSSQQAPSANNSTAQATKRNARKAKAKAKSAEEIDISDSSDDEGYSARDAISAAGREELAKLKQVREKLAPVNELDDDDDDTLEVLSPQYDLLEIIVETSVDTGKGPATSKRIPITLRSNDKLQVLEQALLEELKLSAASTSCYMRCGSTRLFRNRPASFYALESDVLIHADVSITDFYCRSKKTAPNFGPTLQVLVRSSKGTQTVSYGLRQPFKDLMEAHGVLEFDGERLCPDQTPASCEMESGDLIDVVGSNQ